MRCCMNTRRILSAGWGSRTGSGGSTSRVAMDAPQDAINTLAGKLGKLEGISAKTVYSNRTFPASQE